MKKIRLAQDWVDRVTSQDPSDDVIVSGTDFGKPPSAAEFSAMLNKATGADTIREMVRRKWFVPKSGDDRGTERLRALQDFIFSKRLNKPAFAEAVMFRRQQRQRNVLEEIATLAWLNRVADQAAAMKPLDFDNAKLTTKTLEKLVHLSDSDTGPRNAVNYLEKVGIRVIIENSLPGMRMDAASFMITKHHPVIGLTLRHDRLDSFWFTMLHELAHIFLHLRQRADDVFVDSIEDDDRTESEIEAEANAYAKDSFIPRDAWLRSDAFRFGTEPAIIALAKRLKIHPAIVAGRLRFERKNYQKFSNLVGSGQVRNLLMAE